MPPNRAILSLLITPTLALTAGRAVAQDQPTETGAQAVAEGLPDAQGLAAIVEDGERGRSERQDAAMKLVSEGRSRDGLLAINSVLGRGTGDNSGARVLLEAMARTPIAPRELWASVSLVPTQDDPAVRALVASAAGSFRTRQAAEWLVGLLRDDAEPSVRRAAHAALVRLSGRELPAEAQAWEDWLGRQGSVDGVAWLGGLIEGLAARADELERRSRTAEARLTDAYRRLHLALAPEARSGLLATMLHEPIPAVRSLAFDLVDRELASSLELGQEVGEAAVSLLGDPDQAIRRRAAALVVRLAPETGAVAVLERLRVERDPAVAAALLRGVTRWPAPEAAPAVARWAATQSPAGEAALEAAWSLARAGALEAGDARGDLVRTLRERDPRGLSSPALRLLVLIGDEGDLERARGLLASEDADARRRAADALASDPGSTDAILDAARGDAGLYAIARQALASHRTTAAGIEQLCGLPAPSPEARESALLELCARLSVNELVRGAPAIGDAALVDRALTRLEQFLPADGSPATGDLCEGLVLLAGARLEMGRASEALGALDRVRIGADRAALLSDAAATRVSCLLALGRVEEAAALDAGADAWLRGLELAIGTPHARAVHDELTVRFAGTLDEAQTQWLAALRAGLTAAASDAKPTPVSDEGP